MNHRALAAIILVAVATPVALHGKDTESVRREAHVKQADAYATAASIPSLADAPGNELRVWQVGYKSGDVNGTVASKDGATMYSSTLRGERTTKFKTKLFLLSSTKSDQVARLLSRLSKLARLDGRSIECGVMDGVGIYVDGALNGRRFVIYAGTPSACDGPEASLVASTVALAREIAEAARGSYE